MEALSPLEPLHRAVSYGFRAIWGLEYSAIRLRSQERIRFRYKLEGFDHDWTEPLSSRVANYTNLPPGGYRFSVQAFEMNMPEKVTESSLAIEWRPHLYRTGWFIALCTVLILAGVFAVYRLRLRQVHDRFEAVLEERNRIAREMHDTVIQGCTSTSALLEAVVSLDPKGSGALRDLLDTARNQVRATVDEARRAVWNLRQRETVSPEISHLLEQMAQQVTHSSRVPVSFKASGNAIALDRTIEYVVLMVAREAVTNAVHHAQPREIRVNVKFETDNVRMQVQDDGRGFDVEEILAMPGVHFGIIGMRERIEDVGGRFEINSSPGKGTQLSMEVPSRRPAMRKSMESVKV
jgi:signal transduction histidine kinase